MLANPTDREREILGPIAYQPNMAVLHTDSTVLPPYPKAWAAWNYFIPKDAQGRLSVTQKGRFAARFCNIFML